MSKLYEEYPSSNFPDSLDTFNRVTDVTISLLPLVQQYNSLYASGKIDEAYNILKNNPELQNCIINAQTINQCYDAIQSIEKYYFSDVQKYIEQLITYRGDYSTKNTYQKYDVCLYNGSAYLCISDTSIGVLPTDKDYFVQITLQGKQGSPGLGLCFCGSWNSTLTYSSDSCVEYKNCLFASKQDNNTAHTPSDNSIYWSVVVDFKEIAVYDNSTSDLTSTTIQDAINEVNTKINNLTYVENSNHANTATSATNASNSTNAVNATNAVNSDTIDGYHIQVSNIEIQENSTLGNNIIYIYYEEE